RVLGHGVRRRNTELLHLRTSHTDGRAGCAPARRSSSARLVVVGTPCPVVTGQYGVGHILPLRDVTDTTVPVFGACRQRTELEVWAVLCDARGRVDHPCRRSRVRRGAARGGRGAGSRPSPVAPVVAGSGADRA